MIFLHVFAVVVTGSLVFLSDVQGLLWTLGKKQILFAGAVQNLRRSVSGLVSLRMCFVTVLIPNVLFTGRLAKTATSKSFSSLAIRERTLLFVSGGLSILDWGLCVWTPTLGVLSVECKYVDALRGRFGSGGCMCGYFWKDWIKGD